LAQETLPVSPDDFRESIKELTRQLAGRPLDAELDRWLNEYLGPQSGLFQRLEHACRAAVAEGWMCNREASGIKFGRVIKPTMYTGSRSTWSRWPTASGRTTPTRSAKST
jgi:hypothetical protein